ncbi:MAG TPA: hypothetical protein VHC95_05530 [Opitutales bacterium]|nr:hypothetical protein [Opitutales bacterium]
MAQSNRIRPNQAKKFRKHLDGLSLAWRQIDDAITEVERTQAFNSDILKLTREIVFDSTCKCHDLLKLETDLKTITTNVATLVQATLRIAKLGGTLTQENLPELDGAGLPPALREQLEHDLKIVG